jgi:hypothetical protein
MLGWNLALVAGGLLGSVQGQAGNGTVTAAAYSDTYPTTTLDTYPTTTILSDAACTELCTVIIRETIIEETTYTETVTESASTIYQTEPGSTVTITNSASTVTETASVVTVTATATATTEQE